MSRAIIHNSDYGSLNAAKEAIDLYFRQRNEHFLRDPKRAGYKITRSGEKSAFQAISRRGETARILHIGS